MKYKHSWLGFFLAAFLGLMLLLSPGRSIGGYILDPDFNNGGIRIDDIASGDDRANAAALQDDGRIVVAGTSVVDPSSQVSVVRYNGNGTLDTSFAGDGKAYFTLGEGDDGANGVAIMQNGNIVVAGYLRETVDGEKKFALLRLTPTGVADIDFGNSGTGVVTLQAEENDGEAFDVFIDAQNRIVVGGVLRSDVRSWAVAARYLEDGSLDPSFGDGGFRRVETDFNTAAHFVTQRSEGRIMLGGIKESEELPATAALFRLTENGDIDATFGNNGEAVGDLGGNSGFFSGVLLDDLSFVAAGYTSVDNLRSITTAKFSEGGRLDTSFGSNGIAVTDLDPGNAGAAHDVEFLEDDSFLVIGEGENGNNTDIVLIHLDADGTLKKKTVLQIAGGDGITDPSAAGSPSEDDSGLNLMEYKLVAAREEGEPLLTDIDGGDDVGRGVVVTENGRVLVAGDTTDDAGADMALVAFTSDEQDPEPSGNTADLEVTPYFVATMAPVNVSRNGAMSGGVIQRNDAFDCEDSEVEECPLSVTGRGVVFSVASNPSYRETADDDQTGTDADDDNGESSSVFPGWVENSSYNYDTVRRGQTSDGSGVGEFGSDITAVTPDTFYFVRAYALLSNGMVIYGPQKTFKTNDGCFIATAAYGSLLEPQVVVLRQFRDLYLNTSDMGRILVGAYYSLSPGLADFIGESRLLKFAARLVLLPLVVFSYFMVYFSLQTKVMFLLFLLGSGVYLTNSGKPQAAGALISTSRGKASGK